MSDSDYSPSHSPNSRTMMPISEIYEINKGNSLDWGIEGYQVPKKSQLFLIKELTIPKSQKLDMFHYITKRSKDPDCTKYSPTAEQASKLYWKPSNGKFDKAQRRSYVDQIIKLSPTSPGPGAYHNREKGKSEVPMKSKLGKMDKAEILNYLSNTEFHAEETPSPTQYFLKSEEREKAVKII